MSKSTVKIYLRRNETTLSSLNLVEGCDPILVGRSHECALRAPSDETSVSGKHARIFWKGSKLYIADDGSRNGVFRAGAQVVRPMQMKEDAIFAVGNCQVVAGKFGKAGAKGQKRCHKLEYANGENAGKTVDIRVRDGKEDFSLGLDPSCDVCLPDMLVSRRHALFKLRENGECWIADLGSRNGTYVNGEKLSGKERLLKDGDKIAIAYFDFRFLDSRYRHTRVHAWLKLAAMAITVCAVVAVYVVWTVTRESAESTMKKVRELASSGDFAEARTVLESALAARDASNYRAQIDTLAGQLDLWSRTSSEWEGVKQNIADEKFRQARHTLDRLNAGPLDSWVWNASKAADLQKEARFVGTALRFYYSGKEAISSAGHGAVIGFDQAVRSLVNPVEEFLSDADAAFLERDYMSPLVRDLRAMLSELRVICDGFARVDANLANVSSKEPDFRQVLEEFERLAVDQSLPPAVREYLNHQISPCKAFIVAQEFLEKEYEMLVNLDFSGVRAIERDLKLPEPEICIRQSKYSDARAAFMQKHATMQKDAETLRSMVNGLSANGVTTNSQGEAVMAFTTSANWDKALSFDCFERLPPSPRRKEPSGMYDKMLGIEHTYESLKALPNTYNGRSMRMIGFTPECQVARQTFENAGIFVQYLDNEDKKYLQRGAIGKYYTQCMKIALSREKMVSVLKAIKGSKRRRLVAAFYAEYFTPRPTQAAKRVIEAQFKALTREVAELGDAYSVETDPVKQIAIRDKIIEAGLPGDSVVQPKWVQKFY